MSLLNWMPAFAPASHAAGDWIVSGSVIGLAALGLWATVMVTALQRTRLLLWWGQLPLAAAIGGLTALAALQLLPPGPTPGLAEFGYALPPARLQFLALVFGAAAAAWAWPLLAMRQARRRATTDERSRACGVELSRR